MKTQLTLITAAVAIAASFSANANQDYTDATLDPNAQAANDTANPFFDDLKVQRSDMDGFVQGPAGQRTAIVNQNGIDNFAETSQKGQEQYSNIMQTGDLNEARVRQNDSQNESIIVQDGVGNKARVRQLSSELGDSYVNQYGGDDNNAYVTQIRTAYSDSMIEQNGSNNDATVRQIDSTDYTWSFIYQEGEFNVADVEQDMAVSTSSYIYQNGNGGHLAEVYQTGDTHVSTIRQNGSFAYTDVDQSGSGNTSVVTQW